MKVVKKICTDRMGAVDDEPFQEDSRDLLLNHLRMGLREQVEQHAAEVVRVLVGVAELVRHCVEEKVPPLGVQFVRQLRNVPPQAKEASNTRKTKTNNRKKSSREGITARRGKHTR